MGFQPSMFMPDEGVVVDRIRAVDAYDLLLTVHYAKRIPSISHAFGLIVDGDLEGVVTFGTPPSSTLLRGIAGEEWAERVVELNRLVLRNNRKHDASLLVGRALRQLPRPTVVVSFADTGQDHVGIVYQATNFWYTGLSTKFVDPRVKGLEAQHHTSYAHGMTNAEVVEKYGADNVEWVERSRKHRYITFVGARGERRRFLSDLRYPILPYPKSDLTRVVGGGTIEIGEVAAP